MENDGAESKTGQKRHGLSFYVFILFLLCFLMRVVLVEYYTIATPSMAPTIQPGDRVSAIKLFTRKIRANDIIFFNKQVEPEKIEPDPSKAEDAAYQEEIKKKQEEAEKKAQEENAFNEKIKKKIKISLIKPEIFKKKRDNIGAFITVEPNPFEKGLVQEIEEIPISRRETDKKNEEDNKEENAQQEGENQEANPQEGGNVEEKKEEKKEGEEENKGENKEENKEEKKRGRRRK